MALSNASCTGRGGYPAIAGHVHHMFDESEDDLFALSLDDVMSDRPWTADELMGGSVRPASPESEPAPAPEAVPMPAPMSMTAPMPEPAPMPAPAPVSAPAPAPQPTIDPSETAAFLAAAAQRRPTADDTVLYAAQKPLVPAARKPPVMRLDDVTDHQVAFDSWAAADLDETSTDMPVLDGPVNPMYTDAPEDDTAYDDTAAYAGYADDYADAERIETEDYGTASMEYPNDPFVTVPADGYAPDAEDDVAAPAYTEGPADERFADYYIEEEPPHFSQFPPTAKIIFIAIIVALVGIIGFEGFQLFHGATAAESQVQQKEDEDKNYLDVNSLEDDPNTEDED